MKTRRLPRARPSIDTQRLGEAVRGEVDTRIWSSLAIVRSVAVDKTHGSFAEVTLTPSGDTFTVRVGARYAGNGFGEWGPLAADDEVLVLFPSGHPEEGGIVTERLWSQADPPPPEAVKNPDDWLLRTKPGAGARMIADKDLLLQSENGAAALQASGDVAMSSDKGNASVKVGDGQSVNIEVGKGGTATIKAGVGGKIVFDASGQGAIELGDGAVLQVALMGDTAGPYPLVCSGTLIMGKKA
jgi:hypothetical protein